MLNYLHLKKVNFCVKNYSGNNFISLTIPFVNFSLSLSHSLYQKKNLKCFDGQITYQMTINYNKISYF